MSTFLDHANWFFDSAWGDVIVGIAMPLLSAGLAALLVVHQVRRGERLRVADRKSEAVQALTEHLISSVEPSMVPAALTDMTVRQFRNNLLITRAYGFTEAKEAAVVRWVAMEAVYLHGRVETWFTSARDSGTLEISATEDGTLFYSGPIGPERQEISQIAAEAVQALLLWQRGERPTSWFSANSRSGSSSSVRISGS